MALFVDFVIQQWVLVAALLAAIAMLIVHETRKAGPALSPQQAINLVNAEQGLFLDIRDAAEFKQGHIVDALNIPLSKLKAREAELERWRERPVIVVCKMGQTAGGAARQLRAAGFSKVHKMAGGMLEWSSLQLPKVK
jgi:rhodanese-related sulfurtransferase